ncbi:hypothetical protein [Halomonas elongata]|uniref:Uncharacterized protein n=1 Tax=Halomonas elongata (strain ATCC 33173 / DSM 2581 / NBRC 15536 / NCIMB 2198 / 1H9) TaxID=768066 RepID=E1VA44_HALED|nr:hypothetical protein [Halomonas elongata]WBF17673.1 hypothetical protein LM502_16595 [Halomonas elongata]WPU46514.1 hypothetical protein SR933_14830 [Halomonas elongata DSM 2581]CBV43932.1 uncharacterized protein HELO_4048 [Halomonas elongata DSM 2581]
MVGSLPLPVLAPSGEHDTEHHASRQQFAQCVMACVWQVSQRLQVPLVSAQDLAHAAATMDALDDWLIRYAEACLPAEAWPRIAERLAGFGEQAMPRRFVHRDRRVPALVMQLRDAAFSAAVDDELQCLIEACRYDAAFYNAVMGNLQQGGQLVRLAEAAIQREGQHG